MQNTPKNFGFLEIFSLNFNSVTLIASNILLLNSFFITPHCTHFILLTLFFLSQAFADSLRAEVAQSNVSVTVVSAGYIKTQLSMNALTGSGANYGQMDPNTEQGYSADYVAEKVVKAVVQKEKEVVVATVAPKVAIFLRHFLPGVYFYIMAKRAKKIGFNEKGD